MSGGSYNYVYFKFEEFAENLRNNGNPRREAFRKIVALVAKAAYDIEWVDSSDYGPGDENAAIDALLSALGSDPEMVRKALAYDDMMARLDAALADHRAERKLAGGKG